MIIVVITIKITFVFAIYLLVCSFVCLFVCYHYLKLSHLCTSDHSCHYNKKHSPLQYICLFVCLFVCSHYFKCLYLSGFLLFTLSYFFCFMFRSQIIVMACPCTLLWFSLCWSRNTECWTFNDSNNTEFWTLQFFNDSIQIRFQNSCSRNPRNLQSAV